MTLIEELKAARDADTKFGDESGETHSGILSTWGSAITIVERYLAPMAGLDAHALAGLVDAYPCLPGERHTFDAGAKVCLCGALSVGLVQEHPQVCLYAPTAEDVRDDVLTALAAAHLWLVGDYRDRPRTELNAGAWARLADRVGRALSGKPGWMHTARTFRLRDPGGDEL